jgi:hypothetical protein
VKGFFENRLLWTICLGWLQTAILLTRITVWATSVQFMKDLNYLPGLWSPWSLPLK